MPMHADTSDLPYCGRASEKQHLTLADATLAYKTECSVCPSINCDVAAYLPEDTDVTLTCWTDQGQVIIDDPYVSPHHALQASRGHANFPPKREKAKEKKEAMLICSTDDRYWLKTTNNCYIAEKNLYSSPIAADKSRLDPCGPIPFLELANHLPPEASPSPEDPNPPENSTPEIAPRSPHPLTPTYLINVTVGTEYAPCRSCARETCREERTYEFNQEVWLQCLVENNGTWWSETTDFCYVANKDFWESPEGDCEFCFCL